MHLIIVLYQELQFFEFDAKSTINYLKKMSYQQAHPRFILPYTHNHSTTKKLDHQRELQPF